MNSNYRMPMLFLGLIAATMSGKKRLAEYVYNNYSQFGEDGVVEKIFEVIGTQSKIAVEFGAWDGIFLSNTAHLWTNDLSWKAILIEGDSKRFVQLVDTASRFNYQAICAWVGITKEDRLETILEKHGMNEPIDLLSIDVDGNDYHIFESLEVIRPRVIICEYNPTIPIHYDLFTPYEAESKFGASVAALVRIAKKKGYVLIALTTTNAFFVLEKYLEKFKDFETNICALNVNDGYVTLITSQDGKYALIKNRANVYFYGINEQYEGKLLGDCHRFDTFCLPKINNIGSYYNV